jgi:hypothetical protein
MKTLILKITVLISLVFSMATSCTKNGNLALDNKKETEKISKTQLKLKDYFEYENLTFYDNTLTDFSFYDFNYGYSNDFDVEFNDIKIENFSFRNFIPIKMENGLN